MTQESFSKAHVLAFYSRHVWGEILAQRFAMYGKLREETTRAGAPSGDDAFYRSYARLVSLVQSGALGGGRFVATK